MLTSQASSSSASLILSPESKCQYPAGLPEKFRENFVFCSEIFLLEDSVHLIFTDLLEIIEVKQSEVTNYFSLSEYKDELPNVSPRDISFESIIQDREIALFVLKIKSKLFGFQRSSSQLKLQEVLNHVKSFKPIIDQGGDITVEVTFVDQSTKLTSFGDENLEKFMRERHSERFSGIYNYVQLKSEKLEGILQGIVEDIDQHSTMLPKFLLEDDPDSKTPLGRYGSIWTRTHNDKLVIGIPLLCFSKR